MGKMQIDYFVGIDGISITLLVMTSLVMVIAALASWEIKSNLKGFFVLFLILDMAVIGVFCSLDFFLFYMFYELMLLPLILPDRDVGRRTARICGYQVLPVYAIRFGIYAAGDGGLYLSVKDPATGNHTFNMVQMMNPANYDAGFDIFVL